MRLCDLFQQGKFGHSSVSKEHINAPPLTHGFVEAIEVGQVGNVALNASNIASDCIHSLVKFLLAAPRDENVGTLFDRELRRGKPYSGGDAGDDAPFSV